MSDNVYSVLLGDDAPFSGLANNKYTEFLRRGVITAVYYNLKDNSNYNYNTIDIMWIDGQPYTSTNIPLSYPLISTNGWGIQIKPEVGDFVIAAFLPNSKPEILRFLKRSEFLQSGQVNENKQILNQYGDPIRIDGRGSYIPFREIAPGEISVKSKKEAELFMDDFGALKAIVRKQNKDCCNDRLFEISSGESILDEGTQKVKKDENGMNIQFQVLGHKNGFYNNVSENGSFTINNNGWNINCDIDNKMTIKNSTGDILTVDNGKINFMNNKGDSIEIYNGKIKIGTNAKEPAVLGDTLTNFMKTIIGIYNGHTHIYSPGGGSPTPTAPTTSQMTMQDFLSKKVDIQ